MSDPDRLKDYIESLSRELQSLGFTQYEAKAYVALVAHGYGDVDIISQTAGIPRTSGYKVLSSLVDKGLAIETHGRPKIYKPVPLNDVKTAMTKRIDGIFSTLASIHGLVSEIGVPQLIYTLTGKKRVIEKIREYIEMSTYRMLLSIPTMTEFRKVYSKDLQSVLSRGVKTIIITSPLQKVPEGVTVYRKEGILAIDLICDTERALIAAPDFSACGFTENAFLAEHLERFILGSVERP